MVVVLLSAYFQCSTHENSRELRRQRSDQKIEDLRWLASLLVFICPTFHSAQRRAEIRGFRLKRAQGSGSLAVSCLRGLIACYPSYVPKAIGDLLCSVHPAEKGQYCTDAGVIETAIKAPILSVWQYIAIPLGLLLALYAFLKAVTCGRQGIASSGYVSTRPATNLAPALGNATVLKRQDLVACARHSNAAPPLSGCPLRQSLPVPLR